MNVTIDNPQSCPGTDPNYPACCAGWMFTADGDYDLTGYGKFTTAYVRCAVSWYNPVTMKWEELQYGKYDCPDPNMQPQHPWDVDFNFTQDYDDCRVTAQVYIDGSASGSPATVDHVCIHNAMPARK